MQRENSAFLTSPAEKPPLHPIFGCIWRGNVSAEMHWIQRKILVLHYFYTFLFFSPLPIFSSLSH
jgi:hypothetical protein